MAPVMTRLFTPLFTVLLLVFLATMVWTGSPINVKREVLIGFDLLLALVIGLVLYAASARDPQAPPDFFDGLQLLLVVSALVVDVVALTAIAHRISEFGFTPNREAALGERTASRLRRADETDRSTQHRRRRGRAVVDELEQPEQRGGCIPDREYRAVEPVRPQVHAGC